jgi:hypothetical protein
MNEPSLCPRWARCLTGPSLLLLAFAAAAQTYDVQVNPTLNGLDIKVEPVATTGVLVVNLTNNSAEKVRCDLKYQADPQPPSRAYVFVEPGKTASNALRETQKWFSVTVDVECKPARD